MNTQLYLALESIAEPVYVIDTDFNLVYANKIVEKVTGWQYDALRGKKCFKIFGQAHANNCLDNCPVKKLILQEDEMQCRFDRTLRTLSGDLLYVQASAAPIYDDGKISGITVLMQDITKLRQFEELSAKTGEKLKEEFLRRQNLEEALRRSEAMYRAMFEYTGTAIVVVNEDKSIIMANQEVEKMTGYPKDVILYKRTWDEFVHPDDLARMKLYHRERRKAGGIAPNHYEFKLIHASGKIIDIYYTIALIPGTGQSIGSMIDITERKQMERALRESEEKYRQLLEDIEDVFYEVDLKGNYTFLNDSVEGVLGFSKSELLGQNYKKGVDEENAKIAFAAFNKVFRTGKPERGFTWEVAHPDGARRNLEVSISPIRDEAGAITGFRGTTRDITDRIKAEERLRYLSLHDSLTDLYNRTYFEEEMQRLVKGRLFPVSLISADVDDLKRVNDTMGHKKGDELLQAAALAVKNSLRASDVVARVGGDEFVVILPGADEKAAAAACGRIKDTVEKYNRSNKGVSLSISLGWATAHANSGIGDLYKRADDNMYLEKARKKKIKCN